MWDFFLGGLKVSLAGIDSFHEHPVPRNNKNWHLTHCIYSKFGHYSVWLHDEHFKKKKKAACQKPPGQYSAHLSQRKAIRSSHEPDLSKQGQVDVALVSRHQIGRLNSTTHQWTLESHFTPAMERRELQSEATILKEVTSILCSALLAFCCLIENWKRKKKEVIPIPQWKILSKAHLIVLFVDLPCKVSSWHDNINQLQQHTLRSQGHLS